MEKQKPTHSRRATARITIVVEFVFFYNHERLVNSYVVAAA